MTSVSYAGRVRCRLLGRRILLVWNSSAQLFYCGRERQLLLAYYRRCRRHLAVTVYQVHLFCHLTDETFALSFPFATTTFLFALPFLTECGCVCRFVDCGKPAKKRKWATRGVCANAWESQGVDCVVPSEVRGVRVTRDCERTAGLETTGIHRIKFHPTHPEVGYAAGMVARLRTWPLRACLTSAWSF